MLLSMALKHSCILVEQEHVAMEKLCPRFGSSIKETFSFISLIENSSSVRYSLERLSDGDRHIILYILHIGCISNKKYIRFGSNLQVVANIENMKIVGLLVIVDELLLRLISEFDRNV